jgi:U3 small nucleolar RNA-associated protein 6
MADTVRILLEAMVPELEDYARRGYFDRDEIDAIVKRREHFEYQLRRRNAIKSDFLRCAPLSSQAPFRRSVGPTDTVELPRS